MTRRIIIIFCALIVIFSSKTGAQMYTDTFGTEKGKIIIQFIGHGSLMINMDGIIIHVDPWLRLNSYDNLPKADLILITHHHGDHLDTNAVLKIRKQDTPILYTKKCLEIIQDGIILSNGDTANYKSVHIEAVPAYNLLHVRDNGQPYHPKGEGNGYVLAVGNFRIYIGGDTEVIPEMKSLKNVDVAILPCNLPYTMTIEMFIKSAELIQPGIIYPYHYGNTDLLKLRDSFPIFPGTELRIPASY